ncbi:hypothetical protein AGABI2DRAFT_123539 [Agaricus bisporus var. bisporus H97]|uniref:hypothetical protein n=1 Tax=Agaricus bisporus var. bisporus (strain H97 / ATCC MYA-4626 / FGSC 10389) TaxID=936046 RepID=UPI00029F7AD9|nr:hypothetical protein AGABI2DRAFT_123539 [Agaricus bisporus var. bisporus H97]EKV41614.1 hypothetical protein AGABI2DRAFT_123539 [Agaricus bisporus var. bisporus H97]
MFKEDPVSIVLCCSLRYSFSALTGAMAAAPSQDRDNQTPAHFSAHSPSEEYTSIGFPSTGSPRLPAYTPYNDVLPPSSPPATDNESSMTSWDFDSDHLDFSGLSHQDAPLYHLQERSDIL